MSATPHRSDRPGAPIAARWALQRVEPGATPGDAWTPLPGPGTVAASLRAIGQWSVDGPAQDFDAHDWWFRAEFDAPPAGTPLELAFEGLAGHCEVSLDDQPLFASSNMHLAHRVPVPALRAKGNVMLLRFASLTQDLARRRPRPRWRVPMLANQQLRWARISLLGRTPGWSPAAAAVGPWRDITWAPACPVETTDTRLHARIDGNAGVLDIETGFTSGTRIVGARLRLERDGQRHEVALAATPGGRHAARLVIPEATRWWPHTHGEPALYTARLQVALDDTVDPVELDLGAIGFRHLEIDTRDGDFALRVNGMPVFCRGACWTPLDVATLVHAPDAVARSLTQVRDAGMNMLRVPGTGVYEDAAFHDACDRLGILVWQDLMFANMDYPTEPSFLTSVHEEVAQQLARWQGRPSLALVCGNSEAEQQAAMWGAPREAWSQPLFTEDLAALVRDRLPGTCYWPSSAHGGPFPHRNDSGTTSYYGVGAYRRPLEDARRSGVRFASECLAVANLPPPETLARLPAEIAIGDAAWKTRTPRDLGADWDFEDVRDHYLQRLYGVDPAALRVADPIRYLALGRATSAEVMQATLAEWRRPASHCRGALVLFLRDLQAGAGWGLLDDQGAPKAAFHGLRRAMAPLAVFLSDEGTNGLDLHLVNDRGTACTGALEVALYRADGLRLRGETRQVEIPPHGGSTEPVAAWFDEWIDLTGAYRFGRVEYAQVVATLRDPAGDPLAQAFHYPGGRSAAIDPMNVLAAEARPMADGSVRVTLRAARGAQGVHFGVPGYVADDEYFHLAPGIERAVTLRPRTPGAAFAGAVAALNASATMLELPR